ncbi:YHS domain-containing (seleno)protein [Roseibium algae]|uniref:YHS domain-containing (Seleno)protein n=1 Tax=Roseibium algae TaxID=3123038 RepID=A0ABU8TFT7_9HYPH
MPTCDSLYLSDEHGPESMIKCRANGTRMWLCLWVACCLCFVSTHTLARPEVFLPDPIGGYAIGGHDPVAYFVDGIPRQGSRKYEFYWGGVEWVFVNEGNFKAFKRSPEIYAPLFAGCGGYALAEGFATAGNPLIFAMVDGKLVFFHSVVSRFLFLVNGKQLMADALMHQDRAGCKPTF